MKIIQMFQTHDGKLHESQKDAVRHLDKIYGDKLCAIGHDLVKCDGKYGKMTEYIDLYLGAFLELAKIKADMNIENTEGDE